MQSQAPLSFIESLWALKRNGFLTLAVGIAAAALGYALASSTPVTYEVHGSLMLSMDVREDVPEFRYDGYYALLAADLFSGTIAGLASSPETVVVAYENAGIDLPDGNPSRIARSVRAEKVAPQLVRIVVSGKSARDAEALSRALFAVLDRAIHRYNETGDSSIVFKGVASAPWTGTQHAAPLPVALSVFLVVYFAANLVVLFRESLARGA